MAEVAAAVFVLQTAGASSDAKHVLVALGGVLCKVDPSAKHAADVGVTFVKAVLDDVGYEQGACDDEGYEKGE